MKSSVIGRLTASLGAACLIAAAHTSAKTDERGTPFQLAQDNAAPPPEQDQPNRKGAKRGAPPESDEGAAAPAPEQEPNAPPNKGKRKAQKPGAPPAAQGEAAPPPEQGQQPGPRRKTEQLAPPPAQGEAAPSQTGQEQNISKRKAEKLARPPAQGEAAPPPAGQEQNIPKRKAEKPAPPPAQGEAAPPPEQGQPGPKRKADKLAPPPAQGEAAPPPEQGQPGPKRKAEKLVPPPAQGEAAPPPEQGQPSPKRKADKVAPPPPRGEAARPPAGPSQAASPPAGQGAAPPPAVQGAAPPPPDQQQLKADKREEKQELKDAKREEKEERHDARAEQKFQDLVKGRRERVEGQKTVIEEPDRRVIIKENNKIVIKHDDTERQKRHAKEAKVEQRGDVTVNIVVKDNGDRVFVENDRDGNLLRRYRKGRDGREVVLIDNRDYYSSRRGGPRVGFGIGLAINLPPPVIRIPRAKYIVEYNGSSEDDVYEALTAPPVERLERVYSLEEIRRSHDLRERMRRIDLDTINFAFASWEVEQSEAPKLEALARAINRVLDRNPDEVFLIEGHTDAVGSDVDNLSLSDRRAESVANILTDDFNIPPENLVTQGYGEEFLKINTPGPERENRRVAVRRITPLLSQGRETSRNEDRGHEGEGYDRDGGGGGDSGR